MEVSKITYQGTQILNFSEKEQAELDSATLECQFQAKPSRFTRLKACKLYDIVLISLSTLSIVFMTYSLFAYVCSSYGSSNSTPEENLDLSTRDLDITTFGETSFDIKHHWGSYSPYFTGGSNFPGIEGDGSGIPEQCSLNQVHAIHRHGERYPSSSSATPMKALAQKLQDYLTNGAAGPLPPFEFLKSWNYTLGKDLLTPKGVATEFSAGAKFWSDYGKALFKTDQEFYSPDINTYSNGAQRPIPVIRATTQSRIKTSAQAWAAGFFGQYSGQSYSETDSSKLYDLVLQYETSGNNNTLASYYACSIPDEKFPGLNKKDIWINNYLNDTVIRLQNYLPGIELTNSDVYNMQQLCTFETADQGYSHFCDLFTNEEWEGFEYAEDLYFYNWDGFGGGKYTPAEGAGWASEFVARLEGKLITTPANGVNVTLTNNTDTFPIDQPFYLDMSHDADIVYMLTFMELDIFEQELSTTYIDPTRQFILSRVVPFGARLIFEILGCGSDRYVRAKLNDRVLPLGSMRDCPSSSNGLCPFDDFLSSLKKSIADANFDEVCFGDN